MTAVRLNTEIPTRLVPGYIRGLAWVTARHPTCEVRIINATSEAGVGWLQVEVAAQDAHHRPVFPHRYILSPLGRVYEGIPEWGEKPGEALLTFWHRGDVLREADYEEVAA